MDIFIGGHGIKVVLDALEHDALLIGDLQTQGHTQLAVELACGDGGEADIIKLYQVRVQAAMSFS